MSELSIPPSEPVPWLARCEARRALGHLIYARTWYDARKEAMRFFGCEPWEVMLEQHGRRGR